jgi:hypothetical protein
MSKALRIGGPKLGFGQRTWFDNALKPIYADHDIQRETIYGHDGIAAMSRPGAVLCTASAGGGWVEIGVQDAMTVIAVDPDLVWCVVPKRDAEGRLVPVDGAIPIAYDIVHAPFGATFPLEMVRNPDYYINGGLATLVDAPEKKAGEQTQKQEPRGSLDVSQPE